MKDMDRSRTTYFSLARVLLKDEHPRLFNFILILSLILMTGLALFLVHDIMSFVSDSPKNISLDTKTGNAGNISGLGSVMKIGGSNLSGNTSDLGLLAGKNSTASRTKSEKRGGILFSSGSPDSSSYSSSSKSSSTGGSAVGAPLQKNQDVKTAPKNKTMANLTILGRGLQARMELMESRAKNSDANGSSKNSISLLQPDRKMVWKSGESQGIGSSQDKPETRNQGSNDQTVIMDATKSTGIAKMSFKDATVPKDSKNAAPIESKSVSSAPAIAAKPQPSASAATKKAVSKGTGAISAKSASSKVLSMRSQQAAERKKLVNSMKKRDKPSRT